MPLCQLKFQTRNWRQPDKPIRNQCPPQESFLPSAKLRSQPISGTHGPSPTYCDKVPALGRTGS